MTQKLNFNLDWKFIKENIEEAKQPEFDDSNWVTVSTPHTYNDIDTFDNFMEGGHNGERSMFTGKTWYRKHFKLAPIYEDKKIYIEFEGVRQAADVYINGHKLEGKSENGFIPFGYDLTPYVYFGEKENVLAVMVDNTFPYYAEGTNDILSWHDSHWHPTHGGIWRNVYLHIKNKLHITLPLYSYLKTQGTYVYTEDITEDSAKVTVEAEVLNNYSEAKLVEYVVDILDYDGNTILSLKQESKVVQAGEKTVFGLTGEIQTPHLWSPDYPYLYTAKAKLVVEGEVLDENDTDFGVRTFEFTNNQGFFLNGNHLKLRGYGQRPTNEWAGIGAAHPNWMHGFILNKMKESGANMVRWGHSAGAPIDVELADKLGLITLQPGVDGEGSTVGGVYSDVSYKIRAEAFRDMVIYFRNSASILVWEGGNQSVPEEEAQTLKSIVEKWDPKGKRAYAHRRSDSVMAKYIDLSIGTEGSWELKSKGLPIVEGEYNREEAARRVWDRYTPGYENYHTSPGSAYDLTAEDLAKNQAKHYKKISHPAHSGGANWIFSDSTSHGRVHSEVARVSGVVDAVMLEKEAFYAVQAIYRDEPRVHIIGHWNYPEGTVKDIYVMSNGAKVELFVNDKSLGFGKQSDTYLFTFNDVAFEEGTIKAVAFDENNQVHAEQSKKTTGEAVAVRLTPITSPAGFKADGSDYLLIDAEAVDAEGNRVPTFEGRIDFTLEGPAIWRGGYNSGKEGSTNNTYLDLEAGINRVAVRSTLVAGTISVTGKVEGLEPATVTVDSIPVKFKAGLSPEMPAVQEPHFGQVLPMGPGPLDHVDFTADEEGSKLITDFSYSGIHEANGPKTNFVLGEQIYSDEDYAIMHTTNDDIVGSDFIQLPNKDTNYKALDLIHFTVGEDAVIYIGHDKDLERPEWLTEQFEETSDFAAINYEKGFTLFKNTFKAGTTLTLGGNLDERNTEDGLMYLVFAKAIEK